MDPEEYFPGLDDIEAKPEKKIFGKSSKLPKDNQKQDGKDEAKNLDSASDSIKLQYQSQAQSLISQCVEDNPNVKDLVGDFIFDYIYKLIGPNYKLVEYITNMLTCLSIPQQKQFLMSYGNLLFFVIQA